jgi:prepilin-type N-terminal cleavage/methylation domain-containing protein
MLNKLKNNNEGFTIIEVMIVLAIAGLILLIVFLAVPALQRASRNTSRKSDAGHISSAINDYVSNNNGSLPSATAANWGTDPTANTTSTAPNECGAIMQDAGTLSQYTFGSGPTSGKNIYACSTGAGNENKFDVENNSGAALTQLSKDALVLDTDAFCPTTSSSSPKPVTTNAQSSDACLFYTVESTGTYWTWDYIQSQ